MIIIHSEKANKKYLHILKSGSGAKLSFTRQEVFGNMILSLDKIRKRLMVSDVFNPLKLSFIIDLSKTMFISIKKVYRDIQGVEVKNKNLENFLESIHLHFEFTDGRNAINLPLFDRKVDDLKDMDGMEKRTIIWQLLLSKLKLQ